MAPALGQEIFSRGFRLSPTPQEAVTYYLRHLTDGEPLHELVRAVIHHADVYACEPAELARRFRPMPRTDGRFFFAPCKKAARAASSGSGAGQSTAEIKDGEGVQVGELRKLRYKKRGVLTDWLMDEYSSSCGVDGEGGDKQQQFVFCKVYVSPRAAPTSAARHESAAFFALPPAAVTPAPPPQAALPPCAKRAAPPPHAAIPPSPCAKRMRPGPVVHPPALPIRSPLTAARKLYFAPPSPPSVVTQTQPSPAPVQVPAPPVLTRPVVEPRRSPMPAPPWPTPPVVRASCHMPRQAVEPSCRPQVSVAQSKQRRILDPFEAATLTEEQTVAASPDPPPSKQFPALPDDDDDELVKAIEDAMSTAEAEEQTVAAALRDEDEDDWDEFDKELGIEE